MRNGVAHVYRSTEVGRNGTSESAWLLTEECCSGCPHLELADRKLGIAKTRLMMVKSAGGRAGDIAVATMRDIERINAEMTLPTDTGHQETTQAALAECGDG